MKYCLHCGESLIEVAKFCSKCGKHQVTPEVKFQSPKSEPVATPKEISSNRLCLECGLINDSSDSICSRCASKVSINTGGIPTDRNWAVPTIVLILVSLLIAYIFANSDKSGVNSVSDVVSGNDFEVTATDTLSTDEQIDCSKVGKGSSFSDIGRCTASEPSSESSSNGQNSISRSEEEIVRAGLQENCTGLPSNFNALRFQSRGSTFNNYGMPLDLYSLGSTNLTFLDEGSSIRIGYADSLAQSTLNSWQCIFPFDVPR